MACGARAQDQSRRPDAARRIVRVFDFEQRDETDIRVPLFWHATQHNPPQRERPGFPIWNRPALDYSVAARGEGSVRLPVRSGSVGLRLQDGVVPVIPGADYLVSANVRTDKLTHARATLRATLLDHELDPIPGSEQSSELLGPVPGWTMATVALRGDHDHAAFLRIDLEVLQPEQYNNRSLGEFALPDQDHDAAAWFDEVTIVQLARTELTTPASAGVFVAPTRPTLNILVRDMTGEKLEARLRITDIDGSEVDHRTIPLSPGTPIDPWSPEVDRFGWYSASLEVVDDRGLRVGRARHDFAWLPSTQTGQQELELAGDPTAGWTPPAETGAGFGLELARIDRDTLDVLARLIDAGLGDTTIIPVWTESGRLDSRPDLIESLGELIGTVGFRGGEVVLSFDELPEDLAIRHATSPERIGELLGTDRALWRELVEPVLERFGQSVPRWRFGAPPSPGQQPAHTSAEAVQTLASRLAALVPGPGLITPESFSAIPSGPGGPQRAYRIAEGIHADALRDLARTISDQQGVGRALITFEPADPERWAPRHAVNRLIRDVVHARHAFETGPAARDTRLDVLLGQPWRRIGPRARQPSATPELAAWRTLAEIIGPRRVLDRLDAGPHGSAYLLGTSPRDPSGAIVAWSDAMRDHPRLNMLLSDGPVTLVDLFGNREQLDASETGTNGALAHRVPLSNTPVFVEGVDVPMVLFQSGASFEPGSIPADGRTRDVELIVQNPWGDPIAAQLYITLPSDRPDPSLERGQWSIDPRAIRATIGSGEDQRVPIAISMSPAEHAGRARFTILAEIDLPDGPVLLELHPTLKIAAPGIEVDVVAMRPLALDAQGDNTLTVDIIVANAGQTVAGVEIDAYAGRANQSSSIGSIMPGAQARRRMIFPGALAEQTREVFVSIRDTATGARVNRVVPIP